MICLAYLSFSNSNCQGCTRSTTDLLFFNHGDLTILPLTTIFFCYHMKYSNNPLLFFLNYIHLFWQKCILLDNSVKPLVYSCSFSFIHRCWHLFSWKYNISYWTLYGCLTDSRVLAFSLPEGRTINILNGWLRMSGLSRHLTILSPVKSSKSIILIY